MDLKSLFCPNNLWKACKSFFVLIKSVGLNSFPTILSAMLINWVCPSSIALNLVIWNSGVLVTGFNFTFLIISLTNKSASSPVNFLPDAAAFLIKTCLVSFIESMAGL